MERERESERRKWHCEGVRLLFLFLRKVTLLQLAQIQAQEPMLLDPNIWFNYVMLLGLIHDP